MTNTIEQKISEKQPLRTKGEVYGVIRVQNMFMDREMKIGYGKNIVTNTGLIVTLTRLKDTSYAAISHLAIGKSNTAESATQTSLGAETLRKQATVSVDTSNYKVQVSARFTSSEINGTQEVGVFNASSGGQMIARKVLSPAVQIPSGFTMSLTYEISLTRA